MTPTKIKTLPSFFSREECALILRNLFDRRGLWESRDDRKVSYRNGDWFTLGSSLYLDLKSEEGYEDYKRKVCYFNEIICDVFDGVLQELLCNLKDGLDCDVRLLGARMHVGSPGFHIFPPHETFQSFFGKLHTDRQFESLALLPDFPFGEVMEPYSFTIPLCLPYLGGGMIFGNEIVSYREGDCYIHDGLTEHAIAPFKHPVLPTDWRVSIQAHGFKVDDTMYLYW